MAGPQSSPAPDRSLPRSGPPPWYWSYALFGASAAGLSPILLPVMVAAGDGAGQVRLVMEALNVGVLSAPLWGRLADCYHAHRPLFFLGMILVALSLAGFAFSGRVRAQAGVDPAHRPAADLERARAGRRERLAQPSL